MMNEHGFPPYAVHKGEHDQVLLQLEQLQVAWVEDFNLQRLADYLFH